MPRSTGIWREHSPRAFLRTPRIGKTPSEACVSITRGLLSNMQSSVATLLREGRGDELGEGDLEEDLMAHLARLGFRADLVREQASRLSEAREFAAKAKNQSDEEEVAEREEGKVGEEVSGGSRIGRKRRGMVADRCGGTSGKGVVWH